MHFQRGTQLKFLLRDVMILCRHCPLVRTKLKQVLKTLGRSLGKGELNLGLKWLRNGSLRRGVIAERFIFDKARVFMLYAHWSSPILSTDEDVVPWPGGGGGDAESRVQDAPVVVCLVCSQPAAACGDGLARTHLSSGNKWPRKNCNLDLEGKWQFWLLENFKS